MESKAEMKKPHGIGAASGKASTFGGVDSKKHTANQIRETTDSIDLIEQACLDATGATAPEIPAMQKKVGRAHTHSWAAGNLWIDSMDHGDKVSAYKNMKRIVWLTLTEKWGGRNDG